MSMLIKKLLTISLRSAMIVTIALCFSACKKNSDLPELNIILIIMSAIIATALQLKDITHNFIMTN